MASESTGSSTPTPPDPEPSPEPATSSGPSSSSDPADDLAARFTAWLADTYGGPVSTVGTVERNASGFDSEIWYVQVTGDCLPDAWRVPLVLRVKPDVERGAEAHREAEVAAWLVDRGYPAPPVLAVLDAGELTDRPMQVMVRAPGVALLDRVRRAPWSARAQLRALADLQIRLHGLDPDGFPVGDDLLDRRLRLTRQVAEELAHADLASGLARVDALASRLRDAPPAVCHGDFHPLNVLSGDDQLTVIDWTDAGIGDRHGDAARTVLLFGLAAVASSDPMERRVLGVVGPWLGRSYRRAYERALPLDPWRVRAWQAVHLLHGWTQAVALHAGLFDRDDTVADDRRDRVPPGLVDVLAARFDAALADVDG